MRLNNIPMININNFINKASLFFVLIMLVLASCNSSSLKNDVRNAPIDEGKFVEVMVDVRIAESIIRKQSSKGKDPEKVTEQLYASIFEKYNITGEEFEKSIKSYSSSPEKMYEINEKVVEALSIIESEVKAQKSIEKSNSEEKKK